MSSRVRGRYDPPGEHADARRVRKRVRNGIVDAGDLTAREFGLLYLYYPEMLPDVEVREP